MARRELLALTASSFAVIACGQFLGFGDDDDAPASPGDARPDASVVDGSVESGPRCNPNGAWKVPVRLDAISSDGDDEASVTLSSDELSIFVERSTPGMANSALYTATRSSADASFGALSIVAALDTPAFEGHPFLAKDGRSLYFTRSGGATGPDIVRVDRASTDEPFSDTAQPVVTAPSTQGHPHVFDTELWFVSKKPTNGFDGIWVRPLAAPDPTDMAASTALTLAAPDGGDGFHDLRPVLDAAGTTLLFASTRDAPVFAIYVAQRSSPSAPFSVPQRSDALSSNAGDFASWISPDGCHVYLTSRRVGATLDVFMSSRAL